MAVSDRYFTVSPPIQQSRNAFLSANQTNSRRHPSDEAALDFQLTTFNYPLKLSEFLAGLFSPVDSGTLQVGSAAGNGRSETAYLDPPPISILSRGLRRDSACDRVVLFGYEVFSRESGFYFASFSDRFWRLCNEKGFGTGEAGRFTCSRPT